MKRNEGGGILKGEREMRKGKREKDVSAQERVGANLWKDRLPKTCILEISQ